MILLLLLLLLCLLCCRGVNKEKMDPCSGPPSRLSHEWSTRPKGTCEVITGFQRLSWIIRVNLFLFLSSVCEIKGFLVTLKKRTEEVTGEIHGISASDIFLRRLYVVLLKVPRHATRCECDRLQAVLKSGSSDITSGRVHLAVWRIDQSNSLPSGL